jgi:HK97 family phage prohead protease
MPSSKKNSDIQYKAAPQGMVNLDEAEGIVECFVAGIGNKDSVGDVCAPGAFGKSLIRRKPRVVWGHNWNDPIGKVLDMYEVPPSDPRLPGKMKAAGIGGLYARVQFNLKSEKGREAFANVAFFGEEQEWSIGYKTINAKFDPQMQANILYEVELYEVSPVLHGANQLTGTISIKSEDQSSAVLVNEQPSIDGLTVNELSSVLDALKTIASSTDEKCGPGMPMGMPMVMPSAPKPMQVQAPRDVVKPEVPSMPENPMLVAIRRELVSRTGSNIIVRSATDNMVLFDRITSDGVSSTYKLSFHHMNGEFMFGKPEKVNVQATPESSAPEMPSMPQQFGGYEATTAFDAGKSLISFDDAKWGEGFGQQIPAQQVDVSTLNSVINNLEKIIEEKSTYIISVDIENMFQVKQAIDPVLDYYRVDATVTEDGIIVKSLDSEFLDAMDIATKGVLRSIGNMVDRAVDRPNIGGGRNRRDRNPNLASRGRGIGSRGAVVRLSDGTMWDPKNAPDRNNNGIVGEGLTDGRGMSLSQPDPTPDGPDSVGAPKTPGITNVNKTPKAPKRTAVVLDDVKPLPKRTMTTAPGTPPKRTAMTTAPGTPPKRTAERLSSGMDSASRMEMMQNDPVGYYKYLVDSGRFDPDSDDAMDYIRDEGLPKYLLSYGEGSSRRKFPESTATYGGSGLSGAEKMEILDGVKDSSNPLVKKILGTTKPSRLSDKQWAVLNNEFKRNKKKAPSGYVSDVRSGGTVAPGGKLTGGIAYLEPDHAGDKDYENLRDAIQTAMRSNQMLRFDYSGKNREVIPVKIEKNNKTGKWNLTAQDDTGARKLFSLDKMTPSSAERLSSGESDAPDFNNMTPEEAADYAAYMEEETWRDRDDRFSSGEITWVDLAKEEAGDDPEKMADFLVKRGVLEEDLSLIHI